MIKVTKTAIKEELTRLQRTNTVEFPDGFQAALNYLFTLGVDDVTNVLSLGLKSGVIQKIENIDEF